MPRDWLTWHDSYDTPGSRLHRRLNIVQREVQRAIEDMGPGPVRAVSLCAGQGRDLIGALDAHPRRQDVVARLVELDPRNVEIARDAARAAGLVNVEVAVGDAALVDAYAGAVPAHLVLACGVFGNLSDGDVAHTIAHVSRLCAPGATVIWTRHRRPPDLVPAIFRWWQEAGFEEVTADTPADCNFTVGVHRLKVPPLSAEPGLRLFHFVGRDDLGA
jgi:hypothetical protein